MITKTVAELKPGDTLPDFRIVKQVSIIGFGAIVRFENSPYSVPADIRDEVKVFEG